MCSVFPFQLFQEVSCLPRGSVAFSFLFFLVLRRFFDPRVCSLILRVKHGQFESVFVGPTAAQYRSPKETPGATSVIISCFLCTKYVLRERPALHLELDQPLLSASLFIPPPPPFLHLREPPFASILFWSRLQTAPGRPSLGAPLAASSFVTIDSLFAGYSLWDVFFMNGADNHDAACRYLPLFQGPFLWSSPTQSPQANAVLMRIHDAAPFTLFLEVHGSVAAPYRSP